MNPLRKRLDTLREYDEISEASLIARRAFVNNSFDGVLTMVGVVMGSLAVGVESAKVIIVTGLSTAFSIGISGGWGAYLAESAEREHALEELEQVTLTDLQDTKIGKASRMATWVVAAVDGLSPFIAALLVIIPFFVAPLLPSIQYAYYASIAIALLALFGLGIFLGNISGRNIFAYGIKTSIAGLACMAISLALEKLA
ncbi:MAG: VIT1/CCC1 transporter family protein [Anaerolineae bacterium]|nr:VIT1/CCC1 transporter family protein [Anaerolineae bacterium]